LEYVRLYDSTVNDEIIVKEIEKSATKIAPCGKSSFGLAGEDFCFFTQKKPSAFFLVGSAPEGSI
jgi:metal-dependent amidase/aminoacylase/carboxypeptidase family protein